MRKAHTARAFNELVKFQVNIGCIIIPEPFFRYFFKRAVFPQFVKSFLHLVTQFRVSFFNAYGNRFICKLCGTDYVFIRML